jgi:hypothetical protein
VRRRPAGGARRHGRDRRAARHPARSDEQAPRLDVPGAALAAAGCGLLVFGFVRIESAGLAGLAPAVAGLVLIGAFLAWERRAAPRCCGSRSSGTGR